MNNTIIHRELLSDAQRIIHTAQIFGMAFPMKLEPTVYSMTDMLADAYRGGYWDFFRLSNEGFYMAPHSDKMFIVYSSNGYNGTLSADALGIAVCLFAYSHLSFGGDALGHFRQRQRFV